MYFFIECNRKISHASKVLISYVNTKALNKNNIFEAVGCATKNIFSVKMLLFSYKAEKSVKIIPSRIVAQTNIQTYKLKT